MQLPLSSKRAPRRAALVTACAAWLLGLAGLAPQAHAAPVTDVYGSYGGGWASSAGALNPIQPDGSNVLLGFTVNGVTYGTGVNDGLVGGVYTPPQDFRALNMAGLTASDATTYIGIGSHWGGVDQVAAYPGGEVPTNPSPGRPWSYYLDDGSKGLELATGIFNIPDLPGNDPRVAVNGAAINPAFIGDGVPDILITQIGLPAESDIFGFYDAANNPVGTPVTAAFGAVPPIGTQQFAFYQTSGTEHFILNGTRDIRMLAFDFSDLGITAANAGQITRFRQNLSGRSDPAFIALNYTSLPVVPPVLALTKTASPTTMAVGSNGTYTLALANQSTFAPTVGTITITDTLPTGILPTSATGTGWTCTIAGQTVTCTTTAVIAASGNAPAITIAVTVQPTASASVTNTATVSGGAILLALQLHAAPAQSLIL